MFSFNTDTAQDRGVDKVWLNGVRQRYVTGAWAMWQGGPGFVRRLHTGGDGLLGLSCDGEVAETLHFGWRVRYTLKYPLEGI